MTGIDPALATGMRDATHRMGLALHRAGLHCLKGDTVIMLMVHPTRVLLGPLSSQGRATADCPAGAVSSGKWSTANTCPAGAGSS